MSTRIVITAASSDTRRPDQRAKFAVAGGLGLAALAAGGLAWWTARRPQRA